MINQAELERAAVLFDDGKFSECAAACAPLVAACPSNAAAMHLLGLALSRTGDIEQGERHLRRSIEIEPTRAEFHVNLGNLLRRPQKFKQACRYYRRALELAPDHRGAGRSLALTLIDLAQNEQAEQQCRLLIASNAEDAEAWVLLGIALGNAARLPESEAAYRRALEIAPDHGIAQHNLGALLSKMAKPEAALAALDRARNLGAGGYELSFNRARAFLDLNDLASAESEFDRAAALRPLDPEVHLQLARVRFMRGDPKFARALATVSAANRENLPLQLLFAEVLWRAGKMAGAEALLHDLARRNDSNPLVQSTLAAVLLEQGNFAQAESHAIDAATQSPEDPVVIEILVSIMLSRGRAADALPFIKTHRRRMPESQAWIAYEATAARLLGDTLYTDLYDYDRLIRVFEVETPKGWSSMRELNRELSRVLGSRHQSAQHPLDQSLRNGTQSSRSLLTDPDPAIAAILQAFGSPIEDYCRMLGVDRRHPFSARNSSRREFSGAWSVRLRREGHHVNHFHPDGWLSSAYYVDVPPEVKNADVKSGWIKFGEPRYPVPGARAERFIQPKAGRLVLFPSYMWHGTTPIRQDAPRLTIAFDVKPLVVPDSR